MSVSTLVLGRRWAWCSGSPSPASGRRRGRPATSWSASLLAWFSIVGSLLPVLEARSTGIYVRNVVHETWVPWAAVVTVTPTSRVNVILGEGRFVGVWAVQHGGRRGLGRRSRIELASERLLEAWPASRGPVGSDVRRVSRPARGGVGGPRRARVVLLVASSRLARHVLASAAGGKPGQCWVNGRDRLTGAEPSR